jgi:hypothetical protein
VKYVGTIGDIRHFKIKGEKSYFAGLVGGPTAEQVLNGEEFKRTRENMSEFAGCAKVGKAIRTAFSPLNHMFGNRLTGNLTGIIKRVNLEDGSEARGQRAILITQAPLPLKNLDFDPTLSLSSILRAPYTLTSPDDRSSATLAAASFNPQTYLKIPSGVTHFRLVNAIATISDYEFKTETKAYEPKVAAENGVVDIKYTAYLAVDADTGAISLEASFPGALAPAADVSVLNAVGIEFYQKVGDVYYLFASGNALQLVEVF